MEPLAYLPALILLFGLLVGFAIGLLAAGGGQLAVPLLVWGAGLSVHQAVFVSIATVGVVSLIGAVASLRRREVSLPMALIYGVSAAVAAPVGVGIGRNLPEQALLGALALLIGAAGVKLWRSAVQPTVIAAETLRRVSTPALVVGGLFVGLLVGIFGIGGGFIMVPIFVLAGGLSMRTALGSALIASTLGCGAGVAAHSLAGEVLPAAVTALFILGALPGLLAGRRLARRLPVRSLQKLFAGVLLAVAVLMAGRLAWEWLGG